MPTTRPKIAYLTSGAAGMYCGSCMHDNTLARALAQLDVDVQLIPTYTPVRTDEDDVSVDRVFFGGINVYLQQKIPLFRHLPALVDRFFDQPWLIRWATSRAGDTDAKLLGGLTVSMLRGAGGFQRKELTKLCGWLRDTARPDLIVLSNMLIGGCVPALKREIGAPILVTLQGDDIFLDDLPEPHRSQAFAEIRKLVADVDGFLVYSRYYADFMADYFDIPPEKFHIAPLGIDTADFLEFQAKAAGGAEPAPRAPAVGYLARLAPEKGLHILVDAFIELKKRPDTQETRLHIAGWLGDHRKAYADEQFNKLRAAGLGDDFHYAGSVDRAGKIEFLKQIEVLSVPTVYHEPKGLFVLEALAAGVPVVQPAHGAFPELIAATAGGRLVRPEDPAHLADELHALLTDHDTRKNLGSQGMGYVHERLNALSMAEASLQIYRQFLSPAPVERAVP